MSNEQPDRACSPHETILSDFSSVPFRFTRTESHTQNHWANGQTNGKHTGRRSNILRLALESDSKRRVALFFIVLPSTCSFSIINYDWTRDHLESATIYVFHLGLFHGKRREPAFCFGELVRSISLIMNIIHRTAECSAELYSAELYSGV